MLLRELSVSVVTINSCLLAAMTADGWQWGPGDPTFMGYATTTLYLISAWLCWRRANRMRNAQTSAQQRVHLFWKLLAFGLVLLAINKQADLQSAITYFGRGIAKSQGWYAERRVVQAYFVVFVACVSAVLSCGLLWFIRSAWRQCWLAVLGISLQLAFIAVRAASFHHFDDLLGSRIGGAKMNWILECSGLLCIAVAAVFPTPAPMTPRAPRPKLC